MVTPIDPLEGQRYVEPVNSEGQGDYLNHIYNITSTRDYYVNRMADRNLSWQSIVPIHQFLAKHWKIGRNICMKYLR